MTATTRTRPTVADDAYARELLEAPARPSYTAATGQLALPMPALIADPREDADQLTIFDALEADR